MTTKTLLLGLALATTGLTACSSSPRQSAALQQVDDLFQLLAADVEVQS